MRWWVARRHHLWRITYGFLRGKVTRLEYAKELAGMLTIWGVS